MHTEKKGKPDEDLLREMGYEHHDIDMVTIMKQVVLFFVFTLLCYGAAWAFLKLPIVSDYFDRDTNPPARTKLPEGPLVQSNLTTRVEIKELRQKETKALESYGKSEVGAGLYHMPIEKAIDEIATKGIQPTGKDVAVGAPSTMPGTSEVASPR